MFGCICIRISKRKNLGRWASFTKFIMWVFWHAKSKSIFSFLFSWSKFFSSQNHQSGKNYFLCYCLIRINISHKHTRQDYSYVKINQSCMITCRNDYKDKSKWDTEFLTFCLPEPIHYLQVRKIWKLIWFSHWCKTCMWMWCMYQFLMHMWMWCIYQFLMHTLILTTNFKLKRLTW